jgi:hypothetical protein
MLAMTAPSHNLHIELAKKLRSPLKSQDLPHKSEAFILGIPIAHDGVACASVSTPDRKSHAPATGEETRETTGANEIQLSLTHRPVPCCQL